MAERDGAHEEETRLDRLWLAVAAEGGDDAWLRFYEGFAVQRLVVPVTAEDGPPVTLALESGEIALAFDTEARFSAFITDPTEHVTLTGADLARALVPLGLGVALNPGVAPGETVLDHAALAWIGEHGGAEVATEALAAGIRLAPPVAPEEPLLEALGTRLAEMEGHVAEAVLVGTLEDGDRRGCLCVLRLAGEAERLGDEIAAEFTRIGQMRTAQPFAVAIAEAASPLLAAARRNGIGLIG